MLLLGVWRSDEMLPFALIYYLLLVDVPTWDETLCLPSELSCDHSQDSVQFRASFMGPLPLQEYYELIDAHFEVRLQLPDFLSEGCHCSGLCNFLCTMRLELIL